MPVIKFLPQESCLSEIFLTLTMMSSVLVPKCFLALKKVLIFLFQSCFWFLFVHCFCFFSPLTCSFCFHFDSSFCCRQNNAPLKISTGFPGGSDSKQSVCQCRRPGFNPWVKKIPWEGNGSLLQLFLPGESQGQKSLTGYSPWGHRVGHDRTTFSFWSFQVAQWIKYLSASTWDLGDMGSIPGQEDPLEEEMATHSNILAWKITWTKEPGGLQSMVL